jgi:hypothetical protein
MTNASLRNATPLTVGLAVNPARLAKAANPAPAHVHPPFWIAKKVALIRVPMAVTVGAVNKPVLPDNFVLRASVWLRVLPPHQRSVLAVVLICKRIPCIAASAADPALRARSAKLANASVPPPCSAVMGVASIRRSILPIAALVGIVAQMASCVPKGVV